MGKPPQQFRRAETPWLVPARPTEMARRLLSGTTVRTGAIFDPHATMPAVSSQAPMKAVVCEITRWLYVSRRRRGLTIWPPFAMVERHVEQTHRSVIISFQLSLSFVFERHRRLIWSCGAERDMIPVLPYTHKGQGSKNVEQGSPTVLQHARTIRCHEFLGSATARLAPQQQVRSQRAACLHVTADDDRRASY